MRPSSKWGLVVAMMLAVAPAAVQGQDPPPLPDGVTQQMVEQGSQIFAGPGNCVACHGENGDGTAFAPKLNNDTWLNIDGTYEAIVKVITEGVAEPKESMIPMGARGGSTINDEQVKAVAAYVWRLSNGS